MRRLTTFLALFVASPALAQVPKPRPVTAVAPAGAGQPALAVGFGVDGVLRARVCSGKPCDLVGAEAIELPDEARAMAAKARLSVMRIAPARRVVSVEIDDPGRARSYVAIVAAPVDGSGRPKLVFNGYTGLVEGEFGVRHGPLVQRGGPNADGTYSIVIGEQREDLSLCGRPAILSPRLIDAKLELKPAKVQRLPSSERDSANRVVARRLPDDAATSSYKLLRAVAATSAVGNPSALTDGDSSTSWAENRGGDGRGEFVLMDAPSQLPIHALEIVLRPSGPEPDKGVAPSELWLATRSELVHVTLPDDAWKHPAARYEIPLEAPLRSDCLALVTESASKAKRDSRVTVAELSARTEFDASTMDGLVGALAGGGERSEAAADALRALGPAAVVPISKAFDSLDEGGRRVALQVVDQAPCSEGAPLYVRALSGPFKANRLHARDRLRRCGSSAAPELSRVLRSGSARQRPLLAGELALVAPARAMEDVVPLLASQDTAGRRLLRKALGFALRDRSAAPQAIRWLSDASLPEVATLDLLRALGRRAPDFQPAAGRALGRLAQPGASFRTRFLVLGPAAALAEVDAGARAILARSLLRDPSQHVRAEAARRVPRVDSFENELTSALRDPAVRVREAAVITLQTRRGSFASKAVAELLLRDRWPLVRSAAAVALARHAPDPAVDVALAEAAADASREVRAPALLALGQRVASRHAEVVRDRLEDDEEDIEVRVSAAIALGLMCDTEALGELTRYALALSDPSASANARVLAPAALGALARIHPADLRKRLDRLLDPKAPLLARRAAEAALAEAPACGRRAGR